MLTKNASQQLYNQSVLKLREIKSYNDKVNKDIGVATNIAVETEIHNNQIKLDQLVHCVEKNIKAMEKSYINPDTTRRLNMIRQQLKIQVDRRQQLIRYLQSLSTHPNVGNSKQMIKQNENEGGKNNSQSLETRVTLSNETEKYKESIEYQLGLQAPLLAERKKQLTQISNKICNINYVTKQMANFVQFQGQRIDIINQNMQCAVDHISLANNELIEANKSHKNSKKKYIIFALIILIMLGIILFFIFVL